MNEERPSVIWFIVRLIMLAVLIWPAPECGQWLRFVDGALSAWLLPLLARDAAWIARRVAA